MIAAELLPELCGKRKASHNHSSSCRPTSRNDRQRVGKGGISHSLPRQLRPSIIFSPLFFLACQAKSIATKSLESFWNSGIRAKPASSQELGMSASFLGFLTFPRGATNPQLHHPRVVRVTGTESIKRRVAHISHVSSTVCSVLPRNNCWLSEGKYQGYEWHGAAADRA